MVDLLYEDLFLVQGKPEPLFGNGTLADLGDQRLVGFCKLNGPLRYALFEMVVCLCEPGLRAFPCRDIFKDKDTEPRRVSLLLYR